MLETNTKKFVALFFFFFFFFLAFKKQLNIELSGHNSLLFSLKIKDKDKKQFYKKTIKENVRKM